MSRASIAFLFVSTIVGACTPLATYTPPESLACWAFGPIPMPVTSAW